MLKINRLQINRLQINLLPTNRLRTVLYAAQPVLGIALPCLLAFLLLPAAADAQDRSATPEEKSEETLDRPVRLFLDCSRCFTSYMRRNVTMVDHVRDRQQSDVHVVGTRRPTGGGGVTYRLEFIGREAFGDLQFELTYEAASTSTREERRRGLAERLRVGLVPFVNRTPVAEDLEVTHSPGEDTSSSSQEDPWNQWVFDVGASGSFDLQERERAYEVEGNLAADRITQAWKLQFEAEGEREVDEFDRDGETIRSTSLDASLDGDVIKTLGPNSGSGVSASLFTTTFSNIDAGARLRGAAEYNVFPYDISDRKSLTFTYRAGLEYRNYQELTIFGKRRETLLQQAGEVSLRLNQQWGSVFARLRASNFFKDLSKNRLEFDSFVRIRLVEGLSLRLSFDAERIQDQLSLPAGELSEEEILLRRRERATNYAVSTSVGLSYTFGSIFNNVVNTRL